MSVHSDPDTHGYRFGVAVVTVDRAAMDCVLWMPTPGGSKRRTRFHSIEEIEGALGAYANQGPQAKDASAALRFAAQCLHKGGNCK